jgi:hypothetical protein
MKLYAALILVNASCLKTVCLLSDSLNNAWYIASELGQVKLIEKIVSMN